MEEFSFPECPVCGNDPEVLTERSDGTTFYMARCTNPDCEGWNCDLYDSVSACCESWAMFVSSCSSPDPEVAS